MVRKGRIRRRIRRNLTPAYCYKTNLSRIKKDFGSRSSVYKKIKNRCGL